ncbi:MAG TPA: sugar transferase [Actinomycetota bacterium]|nr:sugar transferase [Actinomycetota bacterium]
MDHAGALSVSIDDVVVQLDASTRDEVLLLDELSVIRSFGTPTLEARVETFVPRRSKPWPQTLALVLGDEVPSYLRGAAGFAALPHQALLDLACGASAARKGTCIAVPDMDTCSNEVLSALGALAEKGVSVVPLAVAVERHCRLKLLDDDDMTMPAGDRIRDAMLRSLDIAAGLVGCLVMVFLLPLVATAIWLQDRGPVFYSQQRVGRNGQIFKLRKFRSMTPTAEEDGPRWAAADDARITRTGAFLRRTKIDELPQFINVLAGQMSLVGPRPERPEFVEILRQHVPHYDLRHRVRPGITGWATVKVGYGNTVEAKYLAHQFDLYHLRNRSLQFELEILGRSALTMLLGSRLGDRFML